MLPIAIALGGPWDIAIIGVIVLVLFGGSKLATMGRGAGEAIKEFKKATKDEDNVHTGASQPVSKETEIP